MDLGSGTALSAAVSPAKWQLKCTVRQMSTGHRMRVLRLDLLKVEDTLECHFMMLDRGTLLERMLNAFAASLIELNSNSHMSGSSMFCPLLWTVTRKS